MPPFFNIRGFYKTDPLDKAPPAFRYAVNITVTAVISAVLVYLITDYFQLLEFKNFGVKVFEVVVFGFIAAPVVMFLRKSSSIFIMLVIFIPLFVFDLYLQANVRDNNEIALWTYLPGTFIDNVKILPLRFLMTLSFDAFIIGPVCLWISRITAQIFYGKKEFTGADYQKRKELFSEEWSSEKIDKPHRDFGFYVLRILGFSYLAYLLILLLGMLGSSPWPEQIADLISMTYVNPALAVNTFSKIGIMILLTFIGAYNIKARYYCCWGLITGHAVSTFSSLGFYYFAVNETKISQFLLTSAIVDGVMIILFFIILFQCRSVSYKVSDEKDFPSNFSLPTQLSRVFLFIVSAVSFLMVLTALYFRIFADGGSGAGAVYGYPDPSLGNTLTLYFTVSFLAFILAKSQVLRKYLYSVLLFPFFIGTIAAVIIFIVKDALTGLYIKNAAGIEIGVDWYFMIFIVCSSLIFLLLTALRKLSYDVDFIISSLNPSSAKNVIALAGAFFGEDDRKNSGILRSIDSYISGIRGRKRGLLNFPFWLIENFFNVIFSFHPGLSLMSRDEQRWFIKKYMLRDPSECSKAFVPMIADFSFQIGLAANAMIMFANYSDLNERKRIGYVPFYARDRMQKEIPSEPAPFKNIFPLPKSPEDENNFRKPADDTGKKFVAPRVISPVCENEIPPEMDYVIIGSGAGGAVMSYRLSKKVSDPSKILLIERGNRYQPLQDFNDIEMEMMRKLYKEGGLQQTKKFTMSVLQGECLGGTTVVNNAICIEMEDEIKNKWQNEYGIDLSSIRAEYDRIAEEIDIHELEEKGINSSVSERFKKGVHGFNENSDEKLKTIYPLKANYRNLIGDENWNLGNKRQTKRTMLETYIPWSEANGVNVLSNLTALKFTYSNGKADGVIVRTENGETKKIRVNKAVIVCGGVIASSHFLMRSGIRGNVGKRMSCNFAFPVTFQFEETINAFDGNQITLGALDEKNRAVFETYFNPPASFALSSVPFYFERRNRIMDNYSKLINFGTLVGSEPRGEIQIKPDLINGQPFNWELGQEDISNIRYAYKTILKLGYHAGALKAYLPMKPGIEIELNSGNLRKFDGIFDSYPLTISDLLIGTAHPQGGNIMAGDNSSRRSERVVDQNFRLEGLENVFVADASVFPESMRLNPQWTIMALSSMASEKISQL
ncbi:MAG: GMC family oxidoreductase N-terminal domain-containing protein [Bacteroidetes bacterium]|nr:GMC family oxidoreductase N-terminal domain-containing protein [Bacteroidota bacterium]